MRVIHIPRRFVRHDWGGTEQVIINTIKGLKDIGVEGEIFTTRALSTLNDELMNGVPVHRFDYFYPFLGLTAENKMDMDKKGGNLFSFSLAKALYMDKGTQILHSHTGKRLGGIVRTVAKLKSIPYVVSLHGGYLEIPQAERVTLAAPQKSSFEWGKILGALVGSRKVLSDAGGIICVGKGEYEKIKTEFPDKEVYYLPNGVDTSYYKTGAGGAFRRKYGYSADDRILLTVGRIDPQKNQELLIAAMPKLLAANPHVKLLLIGSVTLMSYYQKLVKMINDLGLANHVRIISGLAPENRDLVDAYNGCDAFVLPSRHEPFGIVLLEAWSAKLPVIASRVGGIPFIIKDNDNGILCESDNSNDFIKAILQVLDNKKLSESLALRGRQCAVDNYEWSAICSRLKSIYEEVIEIHDRKKVKSHVSEGIAS
jgi:glycosyltransferase involved in cell wall biosynthesis